MSTGNRSPLDLPEDSLAAGEIAWTEHQLRHETGCSRILVGGGVLSSSAPALRPWLAGRTVFVLSTPRLRSLHGEALRLLLSPALRVVELEVEDGEGAKRIEVAARLWDQMLAAGGKRDSRMVTFGGGTVGDLGGFAAGCFLRGIAFLQVPTTLLAQVDASVGGKTGVDLARGKNTVGLFHHPDFVLADPRLLGTLPAAELRSGLFESIKMGFLLDPPLLATIETHLDSLLAGDERRLTPVVEGSIAAKRRVVQQDPKEGGQRRLLNFGHTLGHAIEAALGYQGLAHGDAVAYGMLFALKLARQRGLPAPPAQRLRTLIRRCGPPELPTLQVDTLMALMAGDKKATEAGLTWVLPRELGQGQMVSDLENSLVERELATFLADPWA